MHLLPIDITFASVLIPFQINPSLLVYQLYSTKGSGWLVDFTLFFVEIGPSERRVGSFVLTCTKKKIIAYQIYKIFGYIELCLIL